MRLFFLSTGADPSPGSVSRGEGGGDGGEVPPPVVGGLADSGPRPAQPGGGGPGEQTPDLKIPLRRAVLY